MTRREFIGVEREPFDLDNTLRTAGLKELPRNVQLRSQHANSELQKLPEQSQHVIFASYLLNNLKEEPHPITGKMVPGKHVFFYWAVRALAPNGRIVLVQDKGNTPLYRLLANEFGLSFHATEIPKEKAEKSLSKSIRERATPKKRKQLIKKSNPVIKETNRFHSGELPPTTDRLFNRSALASNAIPFDREDYLIPTLMVFSKKTKPKSNRTHAQPAQVM